VRVLLAHGLWRSPLSVARLARELRRSGHRPVRFGYVGAAEQYERIVARLVRRLELLARDGDYAVVGHSMGGLLLRAALPRVQGPPPRHLLMLGTPNRPPRLAQRLGPRWPYRRLTGECGGLLASPAYYAALPEPAVPYTVIAGTRGPRGRWSPFGDEPNDGVVAVSETRVRDDDPVVLVRATHTFLMNHPEARAAVRRALGG